MIRNIRGTVLNKDTSTIVVDVNGIGYLLNTPSDTSPYEINNEVSFFTYLAVRENALDLYGFLTNEELHMFTLLIGLQKIGPKSAMQIMSQADVPLLRKAALSGDASYLSKISGIGKKSAEKIVLGLRDTFGADDLADADYTETDHDVVDALITLGYAQRTARDVVQKIPTDITDTNERIKYALKMISA